MNNIGSSIRSNLGGSTGSSVVNNIGSSIRSNLGG